MTVHLGRRVLPIPPEEVDLDFFAGGGGGSLGLERGTGRAVFAAVNHDPDAITMHRANHPRTRHFQENVWRVNPHALADGRAIGAAWFSPDCTQYSRAKGGKPVKRGIRFLANVIPRFVGALPLWQRPRILFLENVAEFEQWGPCIPIFKCASCWWEGTKGQIALQDRRLHRCVACDEPALKVVLGKDGKALLLPDPMRRGESFRRWWRKLERLGYYGEKAMIDAADYGAPTRRRRLFVIFRRDGRRIVWPAPTHASRQLIATDLLKRQMRPYREAWECIDFARPMRSIFGRPKPLADATMRRIAYGVDKYVLRAEEPFIVRLADTGNDRSRSSPVTDPFKTIRAGGRSHTLVVPSVMPLTHQGGDRVYSPRDPFRTITAANRGEFALLAPTLIQTGYGERAGQRPRVLNIRAPMGALMGGGCKQALVAGLLAKHYGGHLTPGSALTKPFDTFTVVDHHAYVAANLMYLNRGDNAVGSPTELMRTVTAGGTHAALVYTFLTKYFGNDIGAGLGAPFGTFTTKDHYGLVYIKLAGWPFVLSDILMRMLEPRELFNGQGFPPSYILTGTKTSQIARCGNSVSPEPAAAIVAANFAPQRLS